MGTKDVLKNFFLLVITCLSVMFALWVLFSASMYDGTGIFEGGGSLFSKMIGTDEIKNDGIKYLEDTVVDNDVGIRYISGAQKVGEFVKFKDLFMVRIDNDEKPAGTEEGFAIYLNDIRDSMGNSKLEILTFAEITELEEIPASFIYDKDNDLLYFYQSGVFTMRIKVYTSAGKLQEFEFNLPVEVD